MIALPCILRFRFASDALHHIRGTTGKRLYDVLLSAMLFYTYCRRVHFYFLGFLFISFIAAISTIEHVHMTLPAVCSCGACLYAMQGRHNHSWRYFYSLGLSLCSMHARKMLAAASNSNGPWMLLGATVTTAAPSVIMIDVTVDRHFLPLSPSRVHASCSQQCATRLHFVML